MARKTNRQLVVEVVGQDKGLGRTLGTIGDKADRLDGAGHRAGLGLAAIATAGAAAAVGVVALGKHLFGAATELEAVGNKAQTVFGSELSVVSDWADTAAHSMGLTTSEATGLAANFGDLLIPMGFARDEAANMATETIGLAGALSEWSGGQKSAAEVSDILAKAMLGEREGLKSLGISITEADVQARLLANGTNELTGEALQQAKALATQQLIMEKSTDAQAAFAAGGNVLARNQNVLRANILELRDTAAKKLIPVFAAASTMFIEKVVPALAAVGEWLEVNLPPAIDAARDAWERFGPYIIEGAETVGDIIGRAFGVVMSVIDRLRGSFESNGAKSSAAMGKVQAVAQKFGKAIAAVMATVRAVIDRLRQFWARWGDEITAFTKKAFDAIAKYIGGVLDIITGIFATFAAVLSGDWGKAWDGIKLILSGVWDAITGLLELGWETIKLVFALGLGAIKALWTEVWDAVSTKTSEVWGAIEGFVSDGFDAIMEFIRAAPGNIASAAVGLFDGIKDAFISAINWIISKWNMLDLAIPGFSFSIPDWVPDALGGGRTFGWDGIGDLFPDIGPIGSSSGGGHPLGTRLANGGDITREGYAIVGDRFGRNSASAETVYLPRGATVRPGTPDMHGGGATYVTNVEVRGSVLSDRDLLRIIRDAQKRGLTV